MIFSYGLTVRLSAIIFFNRLPALVKSLQAQCSSEGFSQGQHSNSRARFRSGKQGAGRPERREFTPSLYTELLSYE